MLRKTNIQQTVISNGLNKYKAKAASVEGFINNIEDEQKGKDGFVLRNYQLNVATPAVFRLSQLFVELLLSLYLVIINKTRIIAYSFSCKDVGIFS